MSQLLVNSTRGSSTVIQEYSIWCLSWTLAIVVVVAYVLRYRSSRLVSLFIGRARASTPDIQKTLEVPDHRDSNVIVTKILIHPIKVRLCWLCGKYRVDKQFIRAAVERPCLKLVTHQRVWR